MNLLGRQIRRLWDAASAVVFVIAFLQLPYFLEIYRHRLDEQRVQTERTLALLRASPTPDPASIAVKDAELIAIRERLDAASRTGLARLWVFASLDVDLAKRTVAEMKPGLSFDPESLVFGLLGFPASLIFSGLTAAAAGLLLPGRRSLDRAR
jgi:hypothetical protein